MTPHELFREIKDSIGIIQKFREISWAVERINNHFKRPVKCFVEFGCMSGGSLLYIAKLTTAEDSLVIGIDPQKHGAKFKKEYVEARLGREVIFLPGSSLNSKQFLEDSVGDGGIEVLHIDSVHTAAHTETEWAIVKPLMASPSMVIVHDIKPGSRQTRFFGYLGEDIEQLSTGDWWQRIKYGFHYEEKRTRGQDPNNGIGILYL